MLCKFDSSELQFITEDEGGCIVYWCPKCGRLTVDIFDYDELGHMDTYTQTRTPTDLQAKSPCVK